MEAVVSCGVQGVGKSTLFNERFFPTRVRIINLDMLRTRHREAILLHACLAARQPAVVDNVSDRCCAWKPRRVRPGVGVR